MHVNSFSLDSKQASPKISSSISSQKGIKRRRRKRKRKGKGKGAPLQAVKAFDCRYKKQHLKRCPRKQSIFLLSPAGKSTASSNFPSTLSEITVFSKYLSATSEITNLPIVRAPTIHSFHRITDSVSFDISTILQPQTSADNPKNPVPAELKHPIPFKSSNPLFPQWRLHPQSSPKRCLFPSLTSSPSPPSKT